MRPKYFIIIILNFVFTILVARHSNKNFKGPFDVGMGLKIVLIGAAIWVGGMIIYKIAQWDQGHTKDFEKEYGCYSWIPVVGGVVVILGFMLLGC